MARVEYPKFRWFRTWVEYADSICNIQEATSFYDSIATYGLYKYEPTITNPEHLKYFNDVIRPELDSQHRKMDKAKRRREAQKQKRLQARQTR